MIKANVKIKPLLTTQELLRSTGLKACAEAKRLLPPGICIEPEKEKADVEPK